MKCREFRIEKQSKYLSFKTVGLFYGKKPYHNIIWSHSYDYFKKGRISFHFIRGPIQNHLQLVFTQKELLTPNLIVDLEELWDSLKGKWGKSLSNTRSHQCPPKTYLHKQRRKKKIWRSLVKYCLFSTSLNCLNNPNPSILFWPMKAFSLPNCNSETNTLSIHFIFTFIYFLASSSRVLTWNNLKKKKKKRPGKANGLL